MKAILARTLLLAGVSILPALAGNQILLRNLNSADGIPEVLLAGAGGHLFVISALSPTSQPATRIVELDLNGNRLASLDLAQMQAPAAAAMDAQGELIVVGFGQASASQNVVVKVDPQLQSSITLLSLPATLDAVTTDVSGNIYLTGSTFSDSFPVTPGAYQTTPPISNVFGNAAYTFVTEISPTGQMLYSTYFGGDDTPCEGGSSCLEYHGITTGNAIALDASGAVVIAGTTISSDLPTTAGVLAQNCACGYDLDLGIGATTGFVAKFQPAATQQLQWSTYVNASLTTTSLILNSMALDSAGNVIVGGTAGIGLPTTAGAFQVTPGSNPTSGAFLLKLNNTGTAVIWGTYFDNENSDVQTLLVDSQGRVVFSGYAGNPQFTLSQTKPTFVGRMTSDGSTLTDFYMGPETYTYGPALAITSTGGFASMLQNGALWIETTVPGSSLLNISNSASGEYSSSLAPVELITLYGIGIGPQTPVYGQVRGGAYTTSLGGCQVLLNGVALPLLYADSGQINAIVPGGSGGSLQIQVIAPTEIVDGPTVPVTDTPIPGIFQNSQTGLAAALNQDGSINSPSNGAAAGSIVSVFLDANSGVYFPDGSIVPLAIYDATVSVSVVSALDSALSFEVVFAGPAPGTVNGVMQINFRLPAALASGGTLEFSIVVGGATTARIAIAP